MYVEYAFHRLILNHQSRWILEQRLVCSGIPHISSTFIRQRAWWSYVRNKWYGLSVGKVLNLLRVKNVISLLAIESLVLVIPFESFKYPCEVTKAGLIPGCDVVLTFSNWDPNRNMRRWNFVLGSLSYLSFCKLRRDLKGQGALVSMGSSQLKTVYYLHQP